MKRCAALAALFLLGAAPTADTPMIWGDGVHDDTAGFEALMCKRVFRYRPGAVTLTIAPDGRKYFALPGRYFLPSGMPIPRPDDGPQTDLPESPDFETYVVDCGAPTT